MKSIVYTVIVALFYKQMISTSFASFGQEKIIDKLRGTSAKIDVSIVNGIEYLLYFLYLIAVVYGIYGGFLIFTAADDDDKVKRGKTVIIQACIGLVIIFLAGPVARFFLDTNTGILQS